MNTRQPARAAALCLLLAACSAGGVPVASSPTPSQAASSAAATDTGATSSGPQPSPTEAVRPTTGPTPTPTAPPTERPTTAPTTAPVPAKPTGVMFSESTACLLGKDVETGSCLAPDESADPDGSEPTIEVTQTVIWRAPRTEGLEVRVYGVVACVSMPASPKSGSSGPCLVPNTKVPESTRALLATAPASAGTVRWSWRQQEPGCDIWYPVGKAPDGRDYYAVVVAAYSASDHSAFAIATAAKWENPSFEPGDTIC